MHSRPWLWPNLLSLDAPIVAILWQILFLRCLHANVGMLPCLVLALTVWLIYAADRMLDAWRGECHRARHVFYKLHWRWALAVWVAVFALCVWLTLTQLPISLFRWGLLLCIGTALYFAAVHLAPGIWSSSGRKEAAVAVLFALGASLAAWQSVRTSYDVLAILLFSALCWINCIAIEDWEHGSDARMAVVLAALLIGLMSIGLLREHRPILGGAETAGALGLLLIDRWRARVSPEALRVLADVALLSPIVFLPLVGLHA